MNAVPFQGIIKKNMNENTFEVQIICKLFIKLKLFGIRY